MCGCDEVLFLWLVAKPRAMRHPCLLSTGSRICPGLETVHSHAWDSRQYTVMHGAADSKHSHAWGIRQYTVMHGAADSTQSCMGQQTVHSHAWGSRQYIVMHEAADGTQS